MEEDVDVVVDDFVDDVLFVWATNLEEDIPYMDILITTLARPVRT